MALSTFAIAICLVQISCSKTEAQRPADQNTSLNKIIYQEEFPAGANGGNRLRYSIANLDGSGIQHLNIPFPAGFEVGSFHPPVLSTDGTKIFFTGRDAVNRNQGIYSCDTSGANLARIVEPDAASVQITLGSVN